MMRVRVVGVHVRDVTGRGCLSVHVLQCGSVVLKSVRESARESACESAPESDYWKSA
jgi:hypothetical protein